MSGLVRSLFDERVVCRAVRYHEPLSPLTPEEAAQVERAVEKRKLEYRAARHCARSALECLNLPNVALLNDTDRAPIWPSGVVGSLTHTGRAPDGFAAVVVASQADVRALGIDAEVDTPLSDGLFDRVLLDSERRFIEQRHDAERGRYGKLLFSAKESLYKAQFPESRQFLEFGDVEVVLDNDASSFCAVLRRSAGPWPRGTEFHGRYVIDDGLIITGVQVCAG